MTVPGPEVPLLAVSFSLGQAVFVGVYLALLAGILFMPKTLLGVPDHRLPWWKNLRLWAALICGAQIVLYGLLG